VFSCTLGFPPVSSILLSRDVHLSCSPFFFMKWTRSLGPPVPRCCYLRSPLFIVFLMVTCDRTRSRDFCPRSAFPSGGYRSSGASFQTRYGVCFLHIVDILERPTYSFPFIVVPTELFLLHKRGDFPVDGRFPFFLSNPNRPDEKTKQGDLPDIPFSPLLRVRGA